MIKVETGRYVEKLYRVEDETRILSLYQRSE